MKTTNHMMIAAVSIVLVALVGAGIFAAFALTRDSDEGPYTVAHMDADLKTPGKVVWAHRGGSAEFSEMTMHAYESAVGLGCKVLEVSVWRSSDGVYIMSHDQTLTRVTGQTYDIPSTDSATLLGMPVTAPVADGGVIGRLEDLLAAHGKDRVLVIDDKQGANKDDLTALVESHYDSAKEAAEHVVWKVYGVSPRAVEWETAGYHTWSYLYNDEVNAVTPQQASERSYFGLNWDAPQANYDTLLAFGKPIIAHVIQSKEQADVALSRGAVGLQSAVPSVTCKQPAK
ncbi:MAG: hypothetical protein JWP10_677 [Nocardioidaceae bacterium]|nr:hypothetical protein [Nocardioidaceae bacterium]